MARPIIRAFSGFPQQVQLTQAANGQWLSAPMTSGVALPLRSDPLPADSIEMEFCLPPQSPFTFAGANPVLIAARFPRPLPPNGPAITWRLTSQNQPLPPNFVPLTVSIFYSTGATSWGDRHSMTTIVRPV